MRRRPKRTILGLDQRGPGFDPTGFGWVRKLRLGHVINPSCEETDGPPCQLPEKIFAYGEEPTGVRVTSYHKASRIRLILNVLDADEVADKPAFSGRFCRYIISRKLKVAKKHEVWFLFAGKPIRFSLREFALVTEVPVSYVVRMLKKKIVADKDVRIKYAYMALLASVILPTTHTPRISQDHAELIKDLDTFFRIPGGGKEVSLSQNTIALKGFVLSLQLVMVKAVPTLTEAVGDGSSSGSEGDSGEEDDNIDDDKSGKQSISPGHARDIDAAGKDDVMVENMVKLIKEGYAFKPSCFMGGASRVDVCRMREEARTELQNRKTVKPKVDSSAQVLDVLDADSLASIVRDKRKGDISLLQSNMSSLQESLDLFAKLAENEEKIATISAALPFLHPSGHPIPPQTNIPRSNVVEAGTQTMSDAPTIISEALKFANRAGQSASEADDQDSPPLVTESDADGVSKISFFYILHMCPNLKWFDNSAQILDPALLFPNLSFSLGVTQEERLAAERDTNLPVHRGQESADENKMLGEIDKAVIGCRKRKRQKLPTKSLLGQYECDRRFVNCDRQAVVDSHNASGNIDYSANRITTERGNIESTEIYELVERATQLSPKVVDVLIFHIGSFFRSLPRVNQKSPHVFLDTQFVLHFKFPSNVIELIQNNPAHTDAERIYFPFNMDQKYCVGIIIDCSSWTVSVLDCNNALRTNYMMSKEVRPIAQMFPYLLKQVGKVVGLREGKAMAVDRPRSIPQHNAVTNSAVASVFFIQAHAVAGVDGCKCITPYMLDNEVERLIVTLYEGTIGPL
ncbi:hypothetical protein N665_1203s0007 [Sinapis alba]|nr:hypothetical protein N665_1203s0007 [Sinapis alba]